MTSETRVLQALLHNGFIAKCFATLAPGQTYIPRWQVEAIAWQLERVRRGENRRLISTCRRDHLSRLPPRSLFPAHLLGHDPSRRVVCVSYSGDLAKKYSNDARRG
jgi:hypothetical protein